ncbi:hypothetical protein PG985_008075 [Apiospora marii]|uniref:uncharacterized protein n=1 Tax=Apiospora marii TaxID=335849 RepID=UPI00312F3586
MPMEGRPGVAAIEARETIVDERGDLLVGVANDEEEQKFLVDSNALSRASKRWRSAIDDLREIHAGQPRQRKIEVGIKGDPGHHHLLFRIMHGDFESIPDEFAESQLFDLLAIIEYYQVRLSLLRPWICDWIMTSHHWHDPYDATRLYKRLWMAWVLGNRKVFHRALTVLVQEVVPTNGGAELHLAGEPLPQTPEIPGLFVANSIPDYLRREREARVAKLLGVFERQLENCETGQARHCHFNERPDTERSMCDFIVAGSILRGYYDQVAGPAGFPERCQSVKATYDQLRSIVINTYTAPGDGASLPTAWQTHDGRCNPTLGLHEELEVYTEVDDLDPCFLQHLERQARITGFARYL